MVPKDPIIDREDLMMDLRLVREHSRYAELRRRLIEADPEIDETTLLDTLEGATNLNEAIGEVTRHEVAHRVLPARGDHEVVGLMPRPALSRP